MLRPIYSKRFKQDQDKMLSQGKDMEKMKSVMRSLLSDFKEMALDVIERYSFRSGVAPSHPDYDPKVAQVLTAALTEIKQTPAMTTEQFDDWLTSVFDSSDDEL
ncbi:MAG: hypothetical protein VKJ64_09195 [Leptolyngbyaceae bacterium]|nr:hypothetical protein [Leptolyngbyaceae bacterium]